MMDFREVMGKKHSFDVLIYVYQNPGAMQKSIIEGPGRSAKIARLVELIDAKLIYIESSGENWTAIRHYVTPDGARITKGWLAIEGIEGSSQ